MLERLIAVNYFCKEAPLYVFNSVQNTPPYDYFKVLSQVAVLKTLQFSGICLTSWQGSPSWTCNSVLLPTLLRDFFWERKSLVQYFSHRYNDPKNVMHAIKRLFLNIGTTVEESLQKHSCAGYVRKVILKKQGCSNFTKKWTLSQTTFPVTFSKYLRAVIQKN